jgi:phosphatidylserine/phosphatidylglycerophosphate/cardiolipin synthase-like enzyme
MCSSSGEGTKVKLLAMIIIASFSIPFVYITGTGGTNTIMINEIMYNPLGDEVEGEWVELYNTGAEENIGGWNLTDQDGNYYTFPDLVVPPQSFVLVRTSSGNITFHDNVIILYMNRTWSMLNNAGDDLLLVDGHGDAVDYVNYGTGSAVDHPIPPLSWTGTNKTVSEGFSLALIPDGHDTDSDENWLESIPTPGDRNCEDDVSGLLITEVYYNAHRDNEYIKLFNPTDEGIELANIVLSDSDGSLYFPQGSVIGAHEEITIAENSTSFHEDTLEHADFRFVSGNATPLTVSGIFKLKNDGDEVILKTKSGKVLDVFCYGESDYGAEGWTGKCADPLMKSVVARRIALQGQYLDTNTSDDWDDLREYGLGQSEFPLETITSASEVIAFSSPDSSFSVISETIDAAQHTIHIALYKFTSLKLAEHLVSALERGVAVRILLEEGIVQGIEDDQRYIMKAIADKGGEIALMVDNKTAGSFQRYRYLHSKYAVVDSDITIVTSENWGASGIPKDDSYGNRGWGLLIKNKEFAEYMLDVFNEDWNPMRRDISGYFSGDYPLPSGYTPSHLVPEGNYEGNFGSMSAAGNFPIKVVLSPDTSLDEGAIIGMMRNAETSIWIEQFYLVPDWGDGMMNPYLGEVLDAARRGVEVRVLLDGSDYNVEPEVFDNDDVVDYLNELADLEGLNLRAKLFNSTSHGVLKVHNKGMIVDGKTVLVSSINWNRNSISRNRETGTIIESVEIGKHFARIFQYDWKDDVRAPIARGCVNATVNKGEYLTFDGSKSYDENMLRFAWDFDGDGIMDSNASTSKFKYETPGLYRVELNLSDIEGNYNVTHCTVKVLGENDGSPGEGNISTIIFYSLLVSITLLCLFYAQRLRRNGQKLNK